MQNLIVNENSILLFDGATLVRQIKQSDAALAKKLKTGVVRIELINHEDFDIDFTQVKTINKKSFDAGITASVTYGQLTVQPETTLEAFCDELEAVFEFPLLNGSASGGTVSASAIAAVNNFSLAVPVGNIDTNNIYESYIVLPNTTAISTTDSVNEALDIDIVLNCTVINTGIGIVDSFVDAEGTGYYLDPTNDPLKPNAVYDNDNGLIQAYHDANGLLWQDEAFTTAFTDSLGQVNIRRKRTWSTVCDFTEVVDGDLRTISSQNNNTSSMPDGFTALSRYVHIRYTKNS